MASRGSAASRGPVADVHFAYSEDQELLRTTTRRFLDRRHPLTVTRAAIDQPPRLDRGVWKEGASLGWAAFLVPDEHDGGSLSPQPVVDLAAIAEELGRQLYPGPLLATNLVADTIAREGSEQQRGDHLGPIARGERLAAWCLSGDGTTHSDAVDVRLERRGSGDVRLDGSARFVPGAQVADLLLVTARSDAGPCLLLVPHPCEGVSTRPLGTIDITRGYGEVVFEGVVLPCTQVLGGLGEAADPIERALRVATVVQAAECVGAAEHLLEMTVQYAKDRVQFGRAIGSFQAIKHRLADLVIELEGARAAARYAALAVADDRPDRDEAVAVAGSYVRDAFAHLCGEALQLHGGVGFTWEHDVHLFLRRAKAEQGLYGEPRWHRERLCQLIETAEAAR